MLQLLPSPLKQFHWLAGQTAATLFVMDHFQQMRELAAIHQRQTLAVVEQAVELPNIAVLEVPDGVPEHTLTALRARLNATVAGRRLAELTEYLLRELERLARGGADVALFASNTPHLVFEEVRRRAPIPLLSIVEAACAAAEAQGLTRVGLLGTRFTMEARFYPDVFGRAGITVVVPDADERRWVHDRYVNELVQAVFRPETQERMLALVARMKARDGIDGVILGGTELPLLLQRAIPRGQPRDLLEVGALVVQRGLGAADRGGEARPGDQDHEQEQAASRQQQEAALARRRRREP